MGRREVKRAVAAELIHAAGTMIEFWDERFKALGEEPPCSSAEAAEMVATWLKDLPGDTWHHLLPDSK